jgi:hypothetical protein
MLLMAFAIPSHANVITGATGTVTCSSYSLEFSGVGLHPTVTYSVQFSFTLTPTVGTPIPIMGVAAIPSGTSGSFDVTATGSLGPLTEAYVITSSLATLNGSSPVSTIAIAFTSTTLTCTSLPVAPGQAATIGFWHNKDGQALINSFNGASTATALGNWLDSNFPHLFASLAGQTNAQVAADFQTAFGVNGVQGNAYRQAFGVALSIYASTLGLGFNTTAASFGFIGTVGGLGNATFNVGNSGAAFGVANGTTLTVLQVMATANAKYNPATGLFYSGDPTLTSDLTNVLNGIADAGSF